LIGSASEYDGESLRGSGALSAPPPPGYHDGSEERTRMANHILWAKEEPTNYQIGGGSGGAVGVGGSTSNTGVWSAEEYNKNRTTSFSNLAALVGMGLAESMDDSTKPDQMRAVEASIGGSALLDGASRAPMLFDPAQDLSYARQSRQTRSRLIGSRDPASYSFSGSTAAGSLFALETGVRKSETPEPVGSSYDLQYSASGDAESDLLAVFKSSTVHRTNTFGGGASGFGSDYGSGGIPKDVGVTVMEHGDLGRNSAPPQLFEGIISPATTSRGGTPTMSKTGTPVVSRQSTPVIMSRDSVGNSADLMEGLKRNMHNLSIELPPGHDMRSRQSSRSGSSADLSSLFQSATVELEPFVWNVHQGEPSRGIAIFGVQSHQHVQDIRSTCEAFGSLEFFRADFVELGFLIVGYYDLRSAEYAVMELKAGLKRLASIERGVIDVDVKYCVALNWSAAQDESLLVVSDLPSHVSRENVMSVLSALGSIRAISHQQGSRYHGTVSYLVEFHNTSDAKQAVLELESVQPWGPDVLIEIGARLPSDRRKGREFLGVLGRLKKALNGHKTPPPASPGPLASPGDVRSRAEIIPVHRSGSPMIQHPPSLSTVSQYPNSDTNSSSTLSQQTTQLVIGPDGRYSYVVVNPSAYPQHRHSEQHMSESSNSHQGVVRVVHQNGVPHHVVHHAPSHGSCIPPAVHGNPSPSQSHHVLQHHGQHASTGGHYQNSSFQQTHHHYQQQAPSGQPVYLHDSHSYGGAPTAVPYYAHVVTTTTDSSVSSGSVPNQRRPPPQIPDKHQDNRHLMLDIEAVETGQDARTSLMVRNIPNKYTQQMLLSEFTENGHGPGVIDFFYLPIDFKNKCNRGYAFINFVNYRDIVTFHRRYFGQHWKVFNSDKICDITYARIQGKEGMLKRFENSALMEKDDGYKPLVFVSHGSEKGNRISFPGVSSNTTTATTR